MTSSVRVYLLVLLVFVLAVLALAQLLRAGRRVESILATTVAYVLVACLIALWGARFDVEWLSPERVLSSVAVLIIPASVLFVEMLWAFSRVVVWKAVVIAAVSHAAIIVVSDIALLCVGA